MHSAAPLVFQPFSREVFKQFPSSRQLDYLFCYLRDLGAQSIVEEPHFFDRDYLSEFSAFYSLSSRGYPNTCRRWHFFSRDVTREDFQLALGNDLESASQLQAAYLGFAVIRPITATPLGFTVLPWYPDKDPLSRRITEPSRHYDCHVAGLTFSVQGLPWQQQDAAVGACATIGLWSLLHSSGYGSDFSTPTTADITLAAHQTAVSGARVFPSDGLTLIQLLEAIKQYRLAPFVMNGDISTAGTGIDDASAERQRGFSRERFASTCASFIRSGYPVLAIGESAGQGRHAVCITGFRESPSVISNQPTVRVADESLKHVYLHDDNLGPNVRFKVSTQSEFGEISLIPDPPPAGTSHPSDSPTVGHPAFTPQQLIVCTHDSLRTSPDRLNRKGLEIGAAFAREMNHLLKRSGRESRSVLYSCRFMMVKDYVGGEWSSMFSDGSTSHLLGQLRMELQERVTPMSLHIGVVRVALTDMTPLLDVLFDTTDSDLNHPVYAHIAYGSNVETIVSGMDESSEGAFGVLIRAYEAPPVHS